MPYGLCWLVLICVSLGLVVQRLALPLALPWWANVVLGLVGGVALVWIAGLVLCHRGTEVLRWTQQDDEAAGSRGNFPAAHRNGKKSNAERHGV